MGDFALFIDNLLSVFIYPLGFSLTAGLVCLIALSWGWRRTGVACLFATLAILWICSTPLFASFALRTLEARYLPVLAEEALQADVAIVLGGGVRPANSDNPYYDLGESSDRTMEAVRLWRAAKIKKILVTGGGVRWEPGEPTEGDAMTQFLLDLGVPREAILSETRSRNTHENALLSKPVWDQEKFTTGLLVTSALHMPRALAVFTRQGYSVQPASTDAIAGTFPAALPFALLPDVRALDATTSAIKEWLGLIVYRLRGRA